MFRGPRAGAKTRMNDGALLLARPDTVRALRIEHIPAEAPNDRLGIYLQDRRRLRILSLDPPFAIHRKDAFNHAGDDGIRFGLLAMTVRRQAQQTPAHFIKRGGQETDLRPAPQ